MCTSVKRVYQGIIAMNRCMEIILRNNVCQEMMRRSEEMVLSPFWTRAPLTSDDS